MPTSGTSTAGPGASGLHRRWAGPDSPRYKWVALSNTTLGVLMATMNSSIVLISLPAIFRGIDIDPLQPGNISYLLWMIMGYMLVTAVLVVTLGRLGDMYGRVEDLQRRLRRVHRRLDRAGARPVLRRRRRALADHRPGRAGHRRRHADGERDGDPHRRVPRRAPRLRIGTNSVAAIGGSFIGLLVGGVLSEVDWRLVFWVSVPFGVLGTIWAYKTLRDPDARRSHKIDWWGNLTFGIGLILLLVGVIYAIQPYGGHAEGWTNPFVLGCLIVGVCCPRGLLLHRDAGRAADVQPAAVPHPGVRLGNVATLMSALSRGGLQFMLIIWLQGIWLPLHGYEYEPDTAVVGDLHGAADSRLPGLRADRRHAVRPVRRAHCSPPAAW